MLDICTLGDDVLRSPTTEIKVFDQALALLVDAMIDTLDEANGVGLAGPQVGVSKRIFVVHLPDERPIVFINPEIVETSMEMGDYEEGCLSIPGFYRTVKRPLRVKVHARNLEGKAFVVDADGLLARVIQHENDHLYGKLYIDRIDEKEREQVIKSYEKKNKAQRRRNKRV